MELSNGEKLILTMLCDISSHLKTQGRIDHKFVSAAVATGNTWAIKHEYPNIFETRDAPEGVIDDVYNIMDMWSYIEIVLKDLTPTQRSLFEREALPLSDDIRFKGFDPNSEPDHWSAAFFLANHLSCFKPFRGRNLNSPVHTLAQQRNMYATYRKMVTNGSLIGRTNITYLIAILKAAKSPVTHDHYALERATR